MEPTTRFDGAPLYPLGGHMVTEDGRVAEITTHGSIVWMKPMPPVPVVYAPAPIQLRRTPHRRERSAARPG
jgi:hypothetical protein